MSGALRGQRVVRVGELFGGTTSFVLPLISVILLFDILALYFIEKTFTFSFKTPYRKYLFTSFIYLTRHYYLCYICRKFCWFFFILIIFLSLSLCFIGLYISHNWVIAMVYSFAAGRKVLASTCIYCI